MTYSDLSLAEKVEDLYLRVLERLYSWSQNSIHKHRSCGVIKISYLTGFSADDVDPLSSREIDLRLYVYLYNDFTYLGTFIDFFKSGTLFVFKESLVERASIIHSMRKANYIRLDFTATIPDSEPNPPLVKLDSLPVRNASISQLCYRFNSVFDLGDNNTWDRCYFDLPNPLICLLHNYFYNRS